MCVRLYDDDGVVISSIFMHVDDGYFSAATQDVYDDFVQQLNKYCNFKCSGVPQVGVLVSKLLDLNKLKVAYEVDEIPDDELVSMLQENCVGKPHVAPWNTLAHLSSTLYHRSPCIHLRILATQRFYSTE